MGASMLFALAAVLSSEPRIDEIPDLRNELLRAKYPTQFRIWHSRGLTPDRIADQILFEQIIADSIGPTAAHPLSTKTTTVTRTVPTEQAVDLTQRALRLADLASDREREFGALDLALEISLCVDDDALDPLRDEVIERLIEASVHRPSRLGGVMMRLMSRPTAAESAVHESLRTILESTESDVVEATAVYYSNAFQWLAKHRRTPLEISELAQAREVYQHLREEFGALRHPSGMTFDEVAILDLSELDGRHGPGDVPAPARFRPIRQHIRQKIHEGDEISIAVAVVKDGEIAWAEGFGMADVERDAVATSDTIYILASISKPIAASGLMVLRDRGLLELDAPANRYLPGPKLTAYRGNAKDITLRRLLNHTAGLPTHWNFFYNGIEPPDRDESIRRYGFAMTAPGAEYRYSNFAFGVLDYITEIVSGQPWNDFMIDNLYDPIGMIRTGHGIRPGFEHDASVQYSRAISGRYQKVHRYEFDHPGASAIWTSANDLARFAQMHINGGILDGARVFTEKTAREMQTDSTGDIGAGYGLGFSTGLDEGRSYFAHGGGMPGVRTTLRIYPNERCAYVLLANSDSGAALGDVEQLLKQVLLSDAPPPVRSPGSPSSGSKAEQRNPGGFRGQWSGRIAHFAGDIPLGLEFAGRGEVRVQIGRNSWRPLENVQVDRTRMSGRSQRVALVTQSSFHGTPDLRWELRSEGDKLSGVCYADVNGYFRLPHWVELTKVEK